MSKQTTVPNDDQRETLSPFLTKTQDRKRMIIARRRGGLIRSQSLPAPKRYQVVEEPMVVVRRRRPQLQQQLLQQQQRYQSSTSFSRWRLFDNIDNDDDDNEHPISELTSRGEDDTTTRMIESSQGDEESFVPNVRSSLFGTVMKTTTIESNTTPSKKRPFIRHRGDPTTPGTTTTTTISTTRSTSFASPGGFRLLKILDSVASPFRGKEGTPTKSPLPSPALSEQVWKDVELNTTDIYDWSIHQRVRLECHPGKSLPASIQRTNDDAEQEGLEHFLMGTTASTPHGQWEAAMLYWQYPSDIRQVQTCESASIWRSESTTLSLKPTTSKLDSATQLPDDMVKAVRGPTATLHKLARNLDQSNIKRQREWQDAFRSLYFAWRRTLETKQSYFYALLQNRSILFKAQKQSDGTIMPIIVMTASTLEVRKRLKMERIQLYNFQDNKLFNESIWAQSQPDIFAKQEISTPVRSDLEAIRQAQAFSETAGADVSVSTKSVTRTLNRKIPTLYVRGDDDCAAFFEIFMNIHDTNEIPTLLTRRVGRFLHASIKTLSVTHRREGHHMAKDSSCDNNATLELRGPILPCAINELMHATAVQITDSAGIEVCSNDNIESGSYYCILQSSQPDVVINHISSNILFHHTPCLKPVSMRIWDVSRKNVVTIKR